jgi:4-hydroxybenzoate polyprenyltransferase
VSAEKESSDFMQRLRMILEMIRFSHTVFALPFALLSAVMAWTLSAHDEPPRSWRWQEIVGIVACMVFARSAAMAFNRLADRRIDAENPRTAMRHLPAGGVCRLDAAVPTQSLADLSVTARINVLAGLQLHEAVYVARAFLARCGTDARAGGGLDCGAR